MTFHVKDFSLLRNQELVDIVINWSNQGVKPVFGFEASLNMLFLNGTICHMKLLQQRH